MNIFLKVIFRAAALSLAGAIFVPPGAAPSFSFGAKNISDFQAPVANPNGRKIMLKGENAAPKGDTLLEVTRLRVDTFRSNNVPEMVVLAPQCLYDRTSGEASSSGELAVLSADTRLAIRGEGWLFKTGEGNLVISNRVRALVQRSLLGLTNAPADTSGDVTVIADRLRYTGEEALFSGHVRVLESGGEISSGRLLITFADRAASQLGAGSLDRIEAHEDVLVRYRNMQARGQTARYVLKEDVIHIEEKTKWQVDAVDGASDRLRIERKSGQATAKGMVQLQLPNSMFTNLAATPFALSTNSAQLEPVRIHADEFFSSTNLARFTGNVYTEGGTGRLETGLLTLELGPPNKQIKTIRAENGFKLARPDLDIEGGSANYALVSDEMKIQRRDRDPIRWRMAERVGQSDSLVLHPQSKRLEADGGVLFEMPSRGLALSLLSTNTVPQSLATNKVRIAADHLRHTPEVSRFSNNVQVASSDGTLRSGLLTIAYDSTNQMRMITAERNVSIHQRDISAKGEQAEFDVVKGLIELNGEPEILQGRNRITAAGFQINRGRRTFQTKGAYRIELRDVPAQLKESAAGRTNAPARL